MFKNQPKGLIPAALSNMGERFGYYIMNAVLVLFLCSKFGLSEETSALVYSFFYAGIYVLSLVGGIIADRTQNYKGTIISGLIVMTIGYVVLAFPIFATPENQTWLLTLTCGALFLIAFGNGLFKGNLQAIVGQLYDNPRYASQRDAGFQIFYVFINLGGVVAPFVAPLLRSWWLSENGLMYNAELPALCHGFLAGAEVNLANLQELITKVGGSVVAGDAGSVSAFCSNYLNVFNTGIHYSFIASVAAMLISLSIFLFTKRQLPSPAKKAKEETVTYSAEEKAAMATEIKQRMAALFAVLGIAIFFWFSFHQNGTSLSLFARDFVKTDSVQPEIWQALNPFYVIILTPVVMWVFAALARRGKAISTPRKIAIGMGIAALAYIFLTVFSLTLPAKDELSTMSTEAINAIRVTPWIMIGLYFILTVAELFISPLGLSFVSKVAPPHLQGLMQGCWLAATAIGNSLLFIGGILYTSVPIWVCWLVFVGATACSMIVMLSMVRWLERVAK